MINHLTKSLPAIVLSQQSLSTSAPSSSAQFAHNLSLVTSKSDSQRKDALAYLNNTIGDLKGQPLPLPVATILPKIQPLILDASKSVRENFLKLLRALPPNEVKGHVDQMLLYVRAGMTHLAASIRDTAFDALEWLLKIGPDEVVSCSGGWLKTLNCFMSLLGWQTAQQSGKWSSTRASLGKPGAETKLLVKQLTVLAMFLSAGFKDPRAGQDGSDEAVRLFPLAGSETYQLYTRSNPFRNLNLFGAPRDAESNMYDDSEARKRAFDEQALRAVAKGVSMAKKEGGDVGRAAAQIEKALVEGMGDYERESE